MEHEVARRCRRARISETILLMLEGEAIINARMSGADAGHLLRTVDPEFRKKRSPSGRVKEALLRLEKSGTVVLSTNGKYELTKQGKKIAEKLRAGRMARQVSRQRAWDGKWRVIIFDIWERRRGVRDRLRRTLRKVGFVQLQQSVWTYPYPCEDLVAFLRVELKLGPALLYMIVEGIENDRSIRRHFKLP